MFVGPTLSPDATNFHHGTKCDIDKYPSSNISEIRVINESRIANVYSQATGLFVVQDTEHVQRLRGIPLP